MNNVNSCPTICLRATFFSTVDAKQFGRQRFADSPRLVSKEQASVLRVKINIIRPVIAGLAIVVGGGTLSSCSGEDERLSPLRNEASDNEGAASGGGNSEVDGSSLFDDERFELVDGSVIFEGDIILGTLDDVLEQYRQHLAKVAIQGKHLDGAGVFDRSRGFQGESDHFNSGTPWPNRTVRWRFASNFDPSNTLKDTEFRNVIAHYQARTSLKFVEITDTSGDYIEVSRTDTSDAGCASNLGRMGSGKQTLKVGRPDCNFGSMVHELGHALGLIHEHQRPDRNSYVDVDESDEQWDAEGANSVATFGDYEINSIMHYGTPQGDIHELDGDDIALNRTALTDYDIRSIQIMYGAQFQSTLSTVSWGTDSLHAFIRGAQGEVQYAQRTAGGWLGWDSLGGKLWGTPEAVARTTNRLDVFARGPDRKLYHKYWDGSQWQPQTAGHAGNSDPWSLPAGNTLLASDPVVVSPSSSRIDVFAKHDDGSVRQLTWTSGSAWGSWQDRGTPPAVGPVEAVSWGSSRIDLFTIDSNRELRHKAWDGSSWAPSNTGWNSLGGEVIGKPTVVAWGANRLDIFASALDGTIKHKAWDGSAWQPSQTGFNTLSTVAGVGHPVAEAWGVNRLDVFWQSAADRSLVHKAWNGASWTEVNLGGSLVGAPEVVSWGSGRLDVFARGANNALWVNSYNGSWGGFQSMGQQMTW